MTTIIVLAAGLSRRMGPENKLLLPLGNTTVLGQVLRTATGAGADAVLVVTGHEADRVRTSVEQEDAAGRMKYTFNPSFADGMGSSIRTGVAATPAGSAVLIWPGDLPHVQPATVRALVELAEADSSPATVLARPTYLGAAGHPVLFGAAYRAELLATDPARGALPVLQRHRDRLRELVVDDPGVIRDIDTPDDL